MNPMKQFFVAFALTSCSGMLRSQTQVLITSTYQSNGEYDETEETALLEATRAFLETCQQDELYSFICHPSEEHFTSNLSDAKAQLDSIESMIIERPYSLIWKKSGGQIIQKLINQDASFSETVNIDVFAAEDVLIEDFMEAFLRPWAFVFDLTQDQGTLPSNVTVRIHSQFSESDGAEVVQITSITNKQ